MSQSNSNSISATSIDRGSAYKNMIFKCVKCKDMIDLRKQMGYNCNNCGGAYHDKCKKRRCYNCKYINGYTELNQTMPTMTLSQSRSD
jgi:DNA-directed RNA polymerase subunit RPC12/RpoP